MLRLLTFAADGDVSDIFVLGQDPLDSSNPSQIFIADHQFTVDGRGRHSWVVSSSFNASILSCVARHMYNGLTQALTDWFDLTSITRRVVKLSSLTCYRLRQTFPVLKARVR